MKHKCPKCRIPLVPSIILLTDTEWICRSISAERFMHTPSLSYIYWKCPACDYDTISEIEKEVCDKYKKGLYSYVGREKLLRKKGDEQCDTQVPSL